MRLLQSHCMTNSDVMDTYSLNNSKCMLRLLETTANTSDFVLKLQTILDAHQSTLIQ